MTDDPEIAALKDAFSADIVVRTRFYDDYLATACASGCRQIVLLAAGLDTRAFRTGWPEGVTLFELDLAELLAFKREVLAQQGAQPRCRRIAVGVDLRENWSARLHGAGFDADAPTAWLAEGLLAYLSNDDAVRLLDVVGELSARGSQLSCEHAEFGSDSTLRRAVEIPAMQPLTSMWDGGLTADTAEWLRHRGWIVQTYSHSTLARRYGRASLPNPGTGLLTATHLD